MKDRCDCKDPCSTCQMGKAPDENNIYPIPCTKCMASDKNYYKEIEDED